MKKTGFLVLLGSLLFLACKKEKLEPLGEQRKDDTTVTKPAYWCVKKAIHFMYPGIEIHYYFEYEENSLLKTAKAYNILVNGDSVLRFTCRYEYDGVLLIHSKSEYLDVLQNREEIRTYKDGKISIVNQTGGTPLASTRYEYKGNSIMSVTLQHTDLTDTDTILTSYQDFPDSSIAETKAFINLNDPSPTYNFKEKLVKDLRLVILNNGTTIDSIYLTQQSNLFNPCAWDLFDIETTYPTFTNYKMKYIVFSQEHNPFFVDSYHSYGFERKYAYNYDSEGRIISITREIAGIEDALPSRFTFFY